MNVDQLLDPEVRDLLASMPVFGPISADNLAQVREQRSLAPPVQLSDAVERSDIMVPGRAGDPDVMLRVHRPVGVTGPMPCVYWMHGGGFIIGDAKMEDVRFDQWCARLGCVGVSVEYRLSPETPYPGGLEDSYAGLKWTHENAATLGIDTTRFGIGGASAGAGLAATLALLTRDRGEIPLDFQLLIYPMLDDRRVTKSSTWEVPIWPPSSNTFGWSAYLGDLAADAASGMDIPYYAAAARAPDLSGLPRTYISVGTLDGFFDEDLEYARRLTHAGVTVELNVYGGAPHGFDSMAPSAEVSRRARRDVEDWLRRTFVRPATA